MVAHPSAVLNCERDVLRGCFQYLRHRSYGLVEDAIVAGPAMAAGVEDDSRSAYLPCRLHVVGERPDGLLQVLLCGAAQADQVYAVEKGWDYVSL